MGYWCEQSAFLYRVVPHMEVTEPFCSIWRITELGLQRGQILSVGSRCLSSASALLLPSSTAPSLLLRDLCLSWSQGVCLADFCICVQNKNSVHAFHSFRHLFSKQVVTKPFWAQISVWFFFSTNAEHNWTWIALSKMRNLQGSELNHLPCAGILLEQHSSGPVLSISSNEEISDTIFDSFTCCTVVQMLSCLFPSLSGDLQSRTYLCNKEEHFLVNSSVHLSW